MPEDKKRTASHRYGDRYFFPERLLARLSAILFSPLIVVEAPSGFGKTTAVREYIRERVPQPAHVLWYTCLGEPPAKAWDGICGLFAEDSPETAAGLRELGPPTMETLADVAALLRGLRTKRETFLIIDNYQLFDNEIPCEIINAFSVHTEEKLHVVFITQPLPAPKQSFHAANIHRLGSGDFLFDRKSTARLCRLYGVKLSEEGLDYVQRASEGWVAVIRLQAENYRDTGSFAPMGGMDGLVEMAIWNRTPHEGRDFLMAVSLLDSFTPRQAAILLDQPSLPRHAEELLRRNAFIPYYDQRGVYYMHAILQDFLRARFRNAPDGFRREMLRRAGKACADAGEYFEAARFFAELGEYETILSMPITNHYFYNADRKIIQFFAEVFDRCGDSLLLKYPLPLLTAAYQFFKNGIRRHFSRSIGLIKQLLENPSGLSEKEYARVAGEYELLMSFLEYNDIARMSERHRKSYRHLKQLSAPPRSFIFSNAIPVWTWRTPSILSLFWRDRGKLDETLPIMDACLPVYATLAGGHGVGGDSLLRAETHLIRGEDAAAEVLCHRALYDARGVGQLGNCLCAELDLARIAVLRGDREGYEAARRSITRDAYETIHRRATGYMGDMVLARLDLILGKTIDVPPWLRDVDAVRRTQYVQTQPYALTLHSMMLLCEGRRAELYAVSELIFDLSGKLNYLLPRLCQLIYLACAKRADGRIKEAEAYLTEALELALPDRVYLPFAEVAPLVTPLLERTRERFDAEAMEELARLCRRQSCGVKALTKVAPSDSSAQTARQRAVSYTHLTLPTTSRV